MWWNGLSRTYGVPPGELWARGSVYHCKAPFVTQMLQGERLLLPFRSVSAAQLGFARQEVGFLLGPFP